MKLIYRDELKAISTNLKLTALALRAIQEHEATWGDNTSEDVQYMIDAEDYVVEAIEQLDTLLEKSA